MNEEDSIDWVRIVADYRTLAGKRELGCSLDPAEAARLDGLERRLASRARGPFAPFSEREQLRRAVSLIVTFLTAEGPRDGVARDVSGGGMFVTTSTPLAIGARTVVRIIDRFSGDEWRFGAEVVRTDRGGMGLKLEGVPIALRYSHRRRILRAA